MECKQALQEAGGDLDRASEVLQERGLAKAEKKMDRVASQGLIEAYIHSGGRIGVMVEVNCESDFVARTDEFKALAHDLALQVAATAPQYISPEEIPQDTKLNPEEVCLLAQPFIKDDSKKISDLIAAASAKVGEKVIVGRFTRFELGK
ncbi:MAG: elongation factor Ts [Chloroflexi bacterium RBG_13_53_26]|nr:MAG: elongation factor Ts [Chloroflexi bacterium RBG_13_53_26]